MHATIHPYRRPAGAGTDPRDAAAAVVVDHLDDDGGTVVALWPEEVSAPAGTRTYRLVDRVDGSAVGRTPLFAQLTWLNGTGDPAVARAAERGGRERIHPVIRDVEGLVGVLVFRSADDRIVVVGLATGLETLAEIRNRIGRAPLLPGEDPALLPGPDRVQLGRILRADVPVAVRS
ncbi:hypothetical protein [Blastococcus tunisiensis]|uniref:Uncharacterized protein n=1 Tax=Blastococcus tunisiensis TaxID=1798228 RepID=A0A1I2IGU2_9ACTN|nr:hypothetical protein [Blastococcus sp. DSM 46838]SFF41612.1 hypothetical protein SAMN05216574_11363 [Blastococcus sp. DSM 46838]